MPPPLKRPLPVAAPVILSTANRPTQMVPKTPLKRWTGTAPTGSSIFSLSSSFTAQTTISPASRPMIEGGLHRHERARRRDRHQAGQAAVDRHAEVGLAVPDPVERRGREQAHEGGRVRRHEDVGDRVGVRGHRRSGIESEPAEPQHEAADDARRHAVGGNARCTLPPGPYLPRRGPRTRMPASAAQPPTLCTTVEPAKSQKPAVASQPPPQIQ